MLLYVLAVNCSHPQGATSVEDMYSVLYRLPNANVKYLYVLASFRKCAVLLRLY
jgi:hypothetical protein